MKNFKISSPFIGKVYFMAISGFCLVNLFNISIISQVKACVYHKKLSDFIDGVFFVLFITLPWCTNIRNKLQLHQLTLYQKGVQRSLMSYLNVLQN
jgi:hypothetical protein